MAGIAEFDDPGHSVTPAKTGRRPYLKHMNKKMTR